MSSSRGRGSHLSQKKAATLLLTRRKFNELEKSSSLIHTPYPSSTQQSLALIHIQIYISLTDLVVISQPGTIHFALHFLQERCKNLLTFVLSGSTLMNPELFIPVFKHFPKLTKIDLSGNVIDDRAFENIGSTCHNLRYLDVSRSTISDLGLRFLSRSGQNIPR